jgi:excisionase family DNA binding protein
MEKLLLRVEEAAEMLSVSRWTIYRWVEEGRLEATKLGRGTLRIFRASLLKMVDQNRTQDGVLNPVARSVQQPALRRLS